MLKSLKLRILFGVLGIIFLTNFSIMFIVQSATEKALYATQNENTLNLMQTVFYNVENQYKSILFHKEASLERRKSELMNLTTLAVSIVKGYYQDYIDGNLSESDAKQKAINEIKQLRYDGGVGYFWINDTGQPYPKMVLHPIIPELDGKILNDPSFNLALGIRKNLFVASVDIGLESGKGYVDYLWPKPTSDGLSAEQPKISYVQLIEEWNWIIGTGVYVDDIEEDVQRRINAVLEELKDTFSRISFAESGYLYVFNGDNKVLIHPSLEGQDASLLINPATGKLILDELILASKTPEIPLEYLWNKPGQRESQFWKQGYIRYFEPLDWYIASSIYKDEIIQPARIAGRKILLITIPFILAAIVFSLLLSQNLTKPLQKLMLAAQEIEKGGTLDKDIPVSGTIETKELGIILGNMIRSISKTGDQLRQAQKMESIGNLAGGLAHDFNNMLGGIVGSLSLINNKLETDGFIDREPLEEYLGIMNDCSLRASSMVKQLLSLSRTQELTLSKIDLNIVLQDVMKICENSFDKSVQIDSNYSKTPALVLADATQIEQALLNFCINAEHAMTLMRSDSEKRGGILSVFIDRLETDVYFCQLHPEARVGTYYAVSVKDTGVGMDQITISKIFNPFFTTKKTGEGSGLGLSMVYNIIKQHEGFIDVYSEPGIGSIIKIYLPEISSGQIEEENRKVRITHPRGEGLILVVDDEKAVRITAKKILTTNGYRVMLAKNGLEGLKIFNKHHEDISAVLLDLAMPEMSGKAAFIGMKEIDPDIKVALTSGFRHDERVEDLMQLGVKVFVQKPYTYEVLVGVFDSLLQT